MKRIYSTHADHWFAYNDLSAAIVRDLGYPGEKITSANNSIDTNENKLIYDQISDSELDELREKYHISPDSSVGVFCSRLYKEKRLDFLINCVEKIRNHVDNFHYFVIGDGVESPIVKSFSEKNGKWFHWVGPKYGREKIEIFKLADFQLMPDGVGLHIVDSFSLLTPLITTESSHHGPEIVYLENGINGLMTKNTVEAYIKATLCIINDKLLRKKLVEGCVKAREKYTIENMVKRFTNGICHALST